MIVCRCLDGEITHIACDHPCHGTHPRFEQVARKIGIILKGLRPEPTADRMSVCPKCRGQLDKNGWLKADSSEASYTILMAATFGMFRGIPLPPEGRVDAMGRLNIGDTNDILNMFLSDDAKSSDASPSPTGPSPTRPGSFIGEWTNWNKAREDCLEALGDEEKAKERIRWVKAQ